MTDMTVTNNTTDSIWFGPLLLPAGIGQTLVVDITTNESLYLNDDSVAAALNNYYVANKIQVSSPPPVFPRPTGTPQLLHGDGSPQGAVYAPQGSAYLRRDTTGGSGTIYVKTSNITSSQGWDALSTAQIVVPTGIIQAYGGSSAPNSDWLICDGSAISRTIYSDLFAVVGTLYGSGDGSTTFNIPDIRGRTPVGYAASGGHTDVSGLGNSEGSTLANRRPKHPHTNGLTIGNSLTLPDHEHSASISGDVYVSNGSSGSGTYPYDVMAYGGGPNGGWYGEYITAVNEDTPSGAPPWISLSPSVGNPTSNPAISGSVSLTGTIGAAGTANDAPAYIVINYIIKT